MDDDKLAEAKDALAKLGVELDAIGVPAWSQVDQLSQSTGVPAGRVVREALVRAARSPDRRDLARGTALLVDCVHADGDPGSWSSGQLIARIAKGDPDAAIRLVEGLLDLDVAIPLAELGKVADAAAVRGRADVVERSFDILERLGAVPSAYFWSYLLRAHEAADDADRVLETYRRVPEKSPVHLSTAVRTLAAAGRVADIAEIIGDFERDGRPVPGAVVTRYAAALAETSAQDAVDVVRRAMDRGTQVTPPMLASVLGVLQRRHEHGAAARLLQTVTAAGGTVSARNLDALVASIAAAPDPAGLVDGGVADLLGEEQWAVLLDQSRVRGEERLALLTAAPDGAVDLVRPRTFSALLADAARRPDRAAVRRLLDARSTPLADDFARALELAGDLGDAELARHVVGSMFRAGVSPSLETFEAVARSYSGSLDRVEDAFQELLEAYPVGPPRRLAQLLVAAVLRVYAETNQGAQAVQVLGKFAGWPPLDDWSLLEPFLVEVASRRPHELVTILESLHAAVPGGAVPDREVLSAVMLAMARSGHPRPLAQALTWAHRRLGTAAGPRSGWHLRLARAYGLLLGMRGRPASARFDKEARDTWLTAPRAETRLVDALAGGDVDAAKAAWTELRRERPGTTTLPTVVLLRYLELAASAGERDHIVRLSVDRPDLTERDVAEALDRRDARRGDARAVVTRMLGSTGPLTQAAVTCYIATQFEDEAERVRVEARYAALLPVRQDGREAEPGPLLRAVALGHAAAGRPERVRAAMADLGTRVPADAGVWALLQKAHGDDPDATVRVIDEMTARGVEPTVANHREVLAALGATGRLADTLGYVEERRAVLTAPETAALLGQVVAMASAVDDVVLASRARDLVLAIPAALPPGATRAYDAARRRAGDHDSRRLVSVGAAETQVKLDTFVRDVAHDLNNKLGPVWVGLANVKDVLEHERDVDLALEELAEVTRSQAALRALMEHWDQVARDDSASAQSSDVGTVLRRLGQLLRPQLDAIGARLEYNVPPGRYVVQASPYELDLLLRQLLTNSIAHLRKVPEDARVVVVRVVEADAEAGQVADDVLLSVTDSGPGIPRAHREAVFESGFSTKTARGVGRGLALVSQVVDACDGHIAVDSRTAEECAPGQTSFTEFQIQLHRGVQP